MISLFTLAYIHVAFVQVPVNCLEKETYTWSREGVLRVEISIGADNSLEISKYCNKACIQTPPVIQNPDAPSIVVVEQPTTITIQIHKEDIPNSETEDLILDSEKSPEFINRTLPFKDSVHDPDCLSPYKTLLSDMEMFTNTGNILSYFMHMVTNLACSNKYKIFSLFTYLVILKTCKLINSCTLAVKNLL